jgi:hypothetical protein
MGAMAVKLILLTAALQAVSIALLIAVIAAVALRVHRGNRDRRYTDLLGALHVTITTT